MAGDNELAAGVECWGEALKATVSVDWSENSKIGEIIAVDTHTLHSTRSAIPVA
jgi:hypothetical protein